MIYIVGRKCDNPLPPFRLSSLWQLHLFRQFLKCACEELQQVSLTYGNQREGKLYTQSPLFERWMGCYPLNKIPIQWIVLQLLLTVISQIASYPLDFIACPFHNWALIKKCCMLASCRNLVDKLKKTSSLRRFQRQKACHPKKDSFNLLLLLSISSPAGKYEVMGNKARERSSRGLAAHFQCWSSPNPLPV